MTSTECDIYGCMSGLLSGLLRKSRYRAVKPFLRGDVLDLGCGYADLRHWLRANQSYVGVEGRAVIYQWLRDHVPNHSFYLRNLDGDLLQLDRQFDTVVMCALIEHLSHPEKVLQQIPDLLKPEGRLVITTPTRLGERVHRAGAAVRLFSRCAADEHQAIFDLPRLEHLLAPIGFHITLYRRFMFHGNQLAICML